MAQVVKKLQNIVNILDDTKSPGEQVINSIGIDSIAVAIRKTSPIKDVIQFLDNKGRPTQTLTFDGTLKTQENGGVATVFAGNVDDFLDKMNNEFFTVQEGDHEFQVSRGQIVGQSRVFVGGRNEDIDTGSVPETIWAGGGLYTGWSIAAQPVRIKIGGDAADTIDGTGAQKVTVFGLDETGALAEEEIDTAGVNASSATSISFKRVYLAIVTKAGGNKKNAAVITIEQETSGDVNAVISIGLNRTHQAVYTVAVGHKLYVHKGQISTTTGVGSDTTFDLFVDFGGTGIFESIAPLDAIENGGQYSADFDWVAIPAGSDIEYRCTRTTANNIEASASFHGILVVDP